MAIRFAVLPDLGAIRGGYGRVTIGKKDVIDQANRNLCHGELEYQEDHSSVPTHNRVHTTFDLPKDEIGSVATSTDTNAKDRPLEGDDDTD